MIGSDDVQRFRRDGYLHIPRLLDPATVESLRRAGTATLERLAERYDVEATWRSARSLDGAEAPQLHHCHDVQFHDAAFTRALTDPTLLDVFEALLGTADIELHHNKLFVKPPAVGAPFPMHQDWPFFPHESDSTVAAIVHLDDAPEEKGCLRVIPGSHRAGRIDHLGDIDWFLPTDRFPLADAVPVPAEAGDAVFFGCLTVHGSGVNRSDSARTTWLLQVRDAADRPTIDRHRSPGQGTMLRGAKRVDAPAPTQLGANPAL